MATTCVAIMSQGGQCGEPAEGSDSLCALHRTLLNKKIERDLPKVRAWSRTVHSGIIFGRPLSALRQEKQALTDLLKDDTLSTARRCRLEGERDAIEDELTRQRELAEVRT